MDAPTIPVSADSSEGNFEDAIDISVDVVHLRRWVPIEEEMSTLSFRMGMAEAENASLRGKIKTMEAIETVTRSQERRARIEMEPSSGVTATGPREPQEAPGASD
ncbi:hypothetical protein Tco_0603696 [Tanacetum coccineum]